MQRFTALFETGRIIDLIIVLLFAEAVALIGLKRIIGQGPNPSQFIFALASAAGLLLAARFALVQVNWPLAALALACALACALVAHLCDLHMRWRAQ